MATGAQHKSFMFVGTLHHELNNWVTFDYEQSLHETNACPDRLVPCRCSLASRLAPCATSDRRVAPSLRSIELHALCGTACCKHFRPAEKPRRGSFKRLTRAPTR